MTTRYSLLLLSGLLLAACHKDSLPEPALTAGFTVPAVIETTVAVPFQNQSQSALTYKWNFGDRTTDRTAAPTHTYAKAGSYLVTLHAYGAHQDSAVVSQLITVADYAFAHSTAKIAGTYDYKLYRITRGSLIYPDNIPPNEYLGTGVLTVTQNGQAIVITAPTFTTQGVYDPTAPIFDLPLAPGLQFKTDLQLYGIAYFYSVGDSLLISQSIQSGSPRYTTANYYRARRP